MSEAIFPLTSKFDEYFINVDISRAGQNVAPGCVTSSDVCGMLNLHRRFGVTYWHQLQKLVQSYVA